MFKKTITMVMCSMFICMAAFAQEAAQDENYQHPKPAEMNAAVFEEDSFDEAFAAQSAAIQQVPGAITAIGESPIGKEPTDRDYVLARYAAFQRAFGNAISEIVSAKVQELETAVEQGMLSNNEGLKKADLDPKVAAMLNDVIKKELQAKGVDLNDEAAVKAALPRIANSESLKQKIATASTLYVRGVVVAASQTLGGKVGVLVYSTKGTEAVADALATGREFPKFPAQQPLAEQFKLMAPAAVAASMGPRLYIDEKGEPVIVAFAYSQVKGNAAIARREATLMANAAIREFAGTMAAVSSAMENSSDLATLEDQAGNFSNAATVSQTMKSLSSRAAAKMKFNGLRVVWSKRTKLASGQSILVVASAWSPSSAKAAAASVAEADKAYQQSLQPRPAMQPQKTTPAVKKQNVHTDGYSAGGVIF